MIGPRVQLAINEGPNETSVINIAIHVPFSVISVLQRFRHVIGSLGGRVLRLEVERIGRPLLTYLQSFPIY